MKRNQVKLIFLLPAVVWILVFTIFPLGYSLVVSFANIENKVEVTREKVPVLDENGEQVLSRSGKPRTKTVITRDPMTIWTFVGGSNYKRLLRDRQVWTAARVTAVFALFFFHGSPPLFNAERMWSLEFSETEAEQRDLVVLMVCGGAYVLTVPTISASSTSSADIAAQCSWRSAGCQASALPGTWIMQRSIAFIGRSEGGPVTTTAI